MSVGTITQARRFARAFAVAADFAVAVVRHIGDDLAGEFDVALSIDNSLPYLLTADEWALPTAFHQPIVSGRRPSRAASG